MTSKAVKQDVSSKNWDTFNKLQEPLKPPIIEQVSQELGGVTGDGGAGQRANL